METLKNGNAEFGSQAALDLLSTNGLKNLDSVLKCGEVIHRRYNAKAVAVVTLQGRDEKIRVFIKKQWKHSRLIPRMHAFLSGKAFWSYPLREWHGLLHLRSLGIDTAKPLAIFRHRWHPYRAAVITLAVPGQLNLSQMINNGSLAALNNSSRASLVDAIVSVIERIHDAGLGWRSMSIKHFYPALQDNGSWRIWLIDCEGVFNPVKPHHIERERRSVLKSIRKAGVGDDRIEFFAEQIDQRLFKR